MAEPSFQPSADVGPLSGFVGAVCGAALCGSVAVALALALDNGFRIGSLMAAVVFFIPAFIASMFAVPIVALLVGLPFSWVLAQLRFENAVTYTMGGAALGLLPLLAGASGDWETIIKASFGMYGGTCGLLWWRLDRSGRQPALQHAVRGAPTEPTQP